MPSSLTLLVDLDDTLLVNPNKLFMEGYLRLLSRHLSAYISPDRTIHQLIASTDLMLEKKYPYQTLQEVFDADFYPALGVQKEKIQPEIDKFYEDSFPLLRENTARQPEAIRAIEYALSRGFRVVIATNPLFPAIAIEQRLEWAGLPVSKYNFDLVTTYECMHFAKPTSEYYAEILAQLGWPQQPVCMVGNSLEFDILPPNKLGIYGYYLTNDTEDSSTPNSELNTYGTLEGLIPWFDFIASKGIENDCDHFESLMCKLKSTPAALTTLTRHLSSSQWLKPFNDLEGSISNAIDESLCSEKEIFHAVMRDFNVTRNQPRDESISQAIQQEIQRTALYPNQSLIDFCSLRSILLESIDFFPVESINNEIQHPSLGSISLLELLKHISATDKVLLRRIHQYTNAV